MPECCSTVLYPKTLGAGEMVLQTVLSQKGNYGRLVIIVCLERPKGTAPAL